MSNDAKGDKTSAGMALCYSVTDFSYECGISLHLPPPLNVVSVHFHSVCSLLGRDEYMYNSQQTKYNHKCHVTDHVVS